MASKFAPIFALKQQYLQKAITDIEFVAAYIIANVKIKEGNKWLGGRIVEQLGQPGAFADKKWKTFEEFPWLTLSESEVKKFKKVPTSNFIELFQNWQLRKVPQYVNEAIVNWASGKRKVHLYFWIPSSLDVLNMQAEGYRCITAFCEESELTRILQDIYPPYEKRDALKFLVHDLQHLEKFQNELFYAEQVGFSKLISQCPNRIFFHEDEQYQKDLDHVYSDMNACSVHLLEFLKARSKLTEQRKRNLAEEYRLSKEDEEIFENTFLEFLNIWNFDQEILDALRHLCHPTFTPSHAKALRRYFHEKGNEIMETNFPLIEESNIKTKKIKENEEGRSQSQGHRENEENQENQENEIGL